MSTLFGLAQTVIIWAFAGIVFFDPGPAIFAATGAWRIAGAVLAVAGLVLMLVGLGTLGKSVQVAPVPKADGTLRTTGVYAWFRHPMYTGIIAIVAGLFVRQPSAAVLAATLGVIVYLVLKVRYEERLLLLKYPGYAEYRRHAWGVIPFLT